ncbi:crosslink repair DNA glycosylase YcaQ family protein [Gryllotalpicola daejeonensis]|uniref:Crosslink repair DNA glycosylase YcaQ family protein n=1 Tax=Gryllotalpicola daejeonensis TaxID=993087 RepID=A0ABP7ZKZ3_9MICO
MASVPELSREQARRIAVRAQLLDDSPRPSDLVATVEHLTAVQNEPTAAVVPAADLVLFDRLGARYRPRDVIDALESDRTLYELDGMIFPMSQLELRLPGMAAWPPYASSRRWLSDNESFRQDVLDLLEREGPLPTSAVPDTSNVPWESTGWTAGKNVSQLLGLLARRGEIAQVGRDGNERLWDVAWRAYPTVHAELDPAEARRQLGARQLAALGIVRPRLRGTLQEPIDFGPGVGAPVRVAGVHGQWIVDHDQLEHVDDPFTGRTVLVSPFDRLVFDRKRLTDLFEFEYALEMYKPAAKRRFGYYALPVLVGDRFAAILDAASDFARGEFRVNALHELPGLGPEEREGIRARVHELADWLGLEPAWP